MCVKIFRIVVVEEFFAQLDGTFGHDIDASLRYFSISLWTSAYAPVRKTERFKAYVRKAGMVDYWKARGWPGLCHPMGADDFVCD